MTEQQLLEHGDYNSTIPGGYVPLQATDGQAPVWDAARNEYVPEDVVTDADAVVDLAAHNADAAANPAAIAAHNLAATSMLAAHIKKATAAQVAAGTVDDAAITPAGAEAHLTRAIIAAPATPSDGSAWIESQTEPSGRVVKAVRAYHSSKYWRRNLFNDYRARILATNPANLIAYYPLCDEGSEFCWDWSGQTGNLFVNPGFEQAGAGGADVFRAWTESVGTGAIASDASIFRGGTASCKITCGVSGNTAIDQTISVRPNTAYTLTFWTRGDGTHSGYWSLYDVTNSANIRASATAGVTATTWTQITYAFTTATNCKSVRLSLQNCYVNLGISWFDDVAIIALCPPTLYPAGVTPGGAGIGDGLFAPSFSGSGTAAINVFNGIFDAMWGSGEFTILQWFRIGAAAAWTDGVYHLGIEVRADANNALHIGKSTANNEIQFQIYSGGLSHQANITGWGGMLGWGCWAISHSVVNNRCRAFLNGVRKMDSSPTAAWSTPLDPVLEWIGGYNDITLLMSGQLAHTAYWNVEVTEADLIALMTL